MHFNRSLGRGLKMLAILNAGGEHRVASLARAVNLPRSTAFRLLCTLVEDGYVWRDPDSDVYHPTSMVLALSDGFDETARLVLTANPKIAELGKELVWPVVLATLSGTSVLLRQTTDATSPLAVVRYAPGFRTPILEEASGLVLLAFSSRQQREMLLDLLYRNDARVGSWEARQTLARKESPRFASWAMPVCTAAAGLRTAARSRCRCAPAPTRSPRWLCALPAVPSINRSSWSDSCRRYGAPRAALSTHSRPTLRRIGLSRFRVHERPRIRFSDQEFEGRAGARDRGTRSRCGDGRR
jgi:DNA-binding IclR family transcriptional regulator